MVEPYLRKDNAFNLTHQTKRTLWLTIRDNLKPVLCETDPNEEQKTRGL